MTGCARALWKRIRLQLQRSFRASSLLPADQFGKRLDTKVKDGAAASFSSTASTLGKRPSNRTLDFLDFLNASPSPFHAVAEASKRLEQAGFEKLSERAEWRIKRGGKYFFTRNGSSIVAFIVGKQNKPGNGFTIIGAHTDSPCLKVKPISRKEKEGYLEVGVQLYGGGIWHTWFDRDLSVAGRAMVEHSDGSFQHRLVHVKKPILRVPTLAIHLDGSVNDAFKFNKENHLVPILATTVKSSLEGSQDKSSSTHKHHPALMNILAEELDVEVSKIHDFELCLYDTQPATLGGAYDEFIFSARLDNLGMSYCSLMALIESANNISDETNIRLIALFDNEEVGSTTAQGANSNLLSSTLERLVGPDSKDLFARSMSKSILVSADMAHAVHPNYSEKYEENHKPAMHKGTVIKINANQRYATTAPTSLILREVARRKEIPIQEFVVRNDSSCGSTIGPMLSAKLGIRTIDVGNPQLSMHSIREVAGVQDVENSVQLLQSFFELFPQLDEVVKVDN